MLDQQLRFLPIAKIGDPVQSQFKTASSPETAHYILRILHSRLGCISRPTLTIRLLADRGSVTKVGVSRRQIRRGIGGGRFPVRWTLKMELVREDGATEAYDLGSITRSMNDVRPEEVGLTLEEARTLVRCIECRMIADQIHAYTFCCRDYPDCGRVQQFKDVRTKCVQTIHESYRFRGRRITACPCLAQRGYAVAFFPLGGSFLGERRRSSGSYLRSSAHECRIGRHLVCSDLWIRAHARQPHGDLAPHAGDRQVHRCRPTRSGPRAPAWNIVSGASGVGRH
jgi:hypothetical protein